MYEDGTYRAFSGFEWDGDTLLRYTQPSALGGYPHVPQFSDCGEVSKIGAGAFYGSWAVSVNIPRGVKVIGKAAFKNCERLKEVTLPKSLEIIEDSAFENCTSLKSITLPEGLVRIGESAFENCSSLEEIVFPGSVKSIGTRAFARCGLKEVVIPLDLESLGQEVFGGCGALFSATCPRLKKLPERLFAGCGNLTAVNIPDGVEELGSHMFHQCSSMILGGSIALPPSIKKMTFALDDNDVDIFNIYAVPGSFAYEEAETYGIRRYPVKWEKGAMYPIYENHW